MVKEEKNSGGGDGKSKKIHTTNESSEGVFPVVNVACMHQQS